MSYGIMAYAPNKQELIEIQNCKDQSLFDDIVRVSAQTIESNTSWFSHDDDLITLDEALHHVMFDEPKNEHMGYQYGYAYKMVCDYLGYNLYNSAFYPIDVEWANEQLTAAGLSSLDLYDLIYGGALWKIPSPMDFPSIGRIENASLDKIIKELQHAKPTPDSDPWVQDALQDLRQWVRVLQEGDIIVGFYH